MLNGMVLNSSLHTKFVCLYVCMFVLSGGDLTTQGPYMALDHWRALGEEGVLAWSHDLWTRDDEQIEL